MSGDLCTALTALKVAIAEVEACLLSQESVKVSQDSYVDSVLNCPPGRFRALLNQYLQKEKLSLPIIVLPGVGGYTVQLGANIYGPFLVGKKKQALEVACSLFLKEKGFINFDVDACHSNSLEPGRDYKQSESKSQEPRNDFKQSW